MINQSRVFMRINWLSLITISLLLCIVIVFIFFGFSYKNSREQLLNDNMNNLQKEFSVAINVYAEMADFIFKSTVNDDLIKKIVADIINASSAEEADAYRNELYLKLKGFYYYISKADFRQLHFHDRLNHSLLRFHRPKKFGDDLTGIRYSVEYVNKNIRYIAGFEEGRIFNGYRFVYPLIYKFQHIGSVEISVSIKAIIGQLNKLFDYKSQFVISKSQVNKKVFKNEKDNYTEWKLDPNFLIDKKVGTKCILKVQCPRKSGHLKN